MSVHGVYFLQTANIPTTSGFSRLYPAGVTWQRVLSIFLSFYVKTTLPRAI